MRSALLCLCLCALAASARAAGLNPDPGVVADRLHPALGPGALIATEAAEVTAPGALSWAAALGLLRDPIRLSGAYTGRVVTRPVRLQLVTDVGLELGLMRRLALAVAVPLVLYQSGDRLRGTGTDEQPLRHTVAGDLRVRLKAHLFGVGEKTLRALGGALLLQVTAPTAGEHDFAATSGATLELRALLDGRVGRLGGALSVGGHLQKTRLLFESRLGHELTWSAALSLLALHQHRLALLTLAEAEGAIGLALEARPVEARGAVRLLFRHWSIDAGGGAGLDGAIGAPTFRLFVMARGQLPLARVK